MTFLPDAVEAATTRIVVAHQADDQRRQLLGQLMAELRRVGEQHLGGAVELGGGLGDGLAVGAGHQHVHVCPSALAAVMALATAALERLVVVLGERASDRHDSTPASFELGDQLGRVGRP